MSFKSKPIALLLSSLITGVGAWAGYEFNKPKNIKDLAIWNGIKLATDGNDNIWKALYFQKQDTLKEKKINNFSELKKFCLDSWKKSASESSLFKEVETFCTEVFHSRKVRIIAEGLDETKLLGDDKDDDDYKTSFIFNRYSPTFLSLLGNSLTKTTEAEEALIIYKNYCKQALSEDSSEYIQRTYQICQKPKYRTGAELLESEGYEELSRDELEKAWEEVKDWPQFQGNTLLNDIQDKNQNNHWMELKKNKKLFTDQFSKWCDDNKKRKLNENKYHLEVYPAFKARCAKKKSLQDK